MTEISKINNIRDYNIEKISEVDWHDVSKIGEADTRDWLTGWTRRVKLTISNTNIDDDLTDFPVLVYLSTSSGTGSDDVSCVFDEIGANSQKIAITDEAGHNQLYVEIERWDNANEKAWLWVKVPSISSSANTVLYLYYDNDQPDNTTYIGTIGSSAGQNVWDDNFIGVWHLSESGDGTADEYKDSTQYGVDMTGWTDHYPDRTTGKVDYGQDFDTSNTELIWCNTNPAFASITDDITIECLVNAATVDDTWRGVVSRTKGVTEGHTQFVMGVSATSGYGGKMTFYINAWDNYALSTDAVPTGEWHHWAGTFDKDLASNQIRLYKDGALEGTQTYTDPMTATTSYLCFGRWYTDLDNYYYDGDLDEVRYSNIARSAAWIKATKHTCFDNLLTFGNEET